MIKNNQLRQHPSRIAHDSLKLIFWVLFFLLGTPEEMGLLVNFDTLFISFDIGAWIFCLSLFVLCVAIIVSRYFVWKQTFITITDDTFVYDKRTRIFKKKVNVRLERIATVNLQRGILNRIWDTYTVKLDINSSVTSENTDFKLVLKKDVAVWLRREIGARKNGYAANENILAPQENKEPAAPVLRFGTGYIVRHSLVATHLGTILAFGAVLAGVSVPFWELSDIVLQLVLALGIPAALLFSIAIIIIRDIFRYYGFTVSREASDLTVTFGLITCRSYRIPIEKVNALVVNQGVIGRLSGMYYLEILNVGMGEEQEKVSPMFCLSVNRFHLDWTVKTMLPEFSGELQFEEKPKKAFLPKAIKGLLWFVIFGAAIALIAIGEGMEQIIAIGLPIVFVISVAVSYASHRAEKIALDNRLLFISRGIFSRRMIIVPFAKVQKVKIIKGPIGGMLGVRQGVISILATAAERYNATGYFLPQAFEKIAEKTEKSKSIDWSR